MDVNYKLPFFLLLLSLVLLPVFSSADDCGCSAGTPGDSSDISSGYGSSQDPMIHLVRAREYLARGELAMAMAECRESLTLDPHDMQALLLEGEILFQMGRYGEAAAAFQEVTMLYPSEEEAYTRLGNTYLLLGDYPAAEKAYIRSLAIRPNDPVVRKNLEKATSLAGRVNAVRKEGVLEKDTVTGTVSPAVEESPAPAEIATLREGGTVPVPFGTPTTDLSPVPSLFALVVVTLLSRIGEMDRRFFFYLKGSG